MDSPSFGDGWHGWIARCEDVIKAPQSWGLSACCRGPWKTMTFKNAEAIVIKDWGHNGLCVPGMYELDTSNGSTEGFDSGVRPANGVWWMAGEVGPRLGPSAKYKWSAGSGFDANVPPALRRPLTINYSQAKSDIMASKIIQYG